MGGYWGPGAPGGPLPHPLLLLLVLCTSVLLVLLLVILLVVLLLLILLVVVLLLVGGMGVGGWGDGVGGCLYWVDPVCGFVYGDCVCVGWDWVCVLGGNVSLM